MFRFRQAEDAIRLAEAVGQVVPLNGRNDAWRRIDEYAEQLGMSGTDAMLRVVAADRHTQAAIRAAKRCLQQDPLSWFNHRYEKAQRLTNGQRLLPGDRDGDLLRSPASRAAEC